MVFSFFPIFLATILCRPLKAPPKQNKILLTEAKAVTGASSSFTLNNKEKKIDIAIVSSLDNKKKNSVLSNNNANNNIKNNQKQKMHISGVGSHNAKNIKSSKIEEELCDGYKSNDSSELSEEEYTYT
jgi:hypothetical protein